MPAAPTVCFFFIFSYLFPKFAYISFLYDVIYQKYLKTAKRTLVSFSFINFVWYMRACAV